MVPFMIKKFKKKFEEKILIFIGSSSAAKFAKNVSIYGFTATDNECKPLQDVNVDFVFYNEYCNECCFIMQEMLW